MGAFECLPYVGALFGPLYLRILASGVPDAFRGPEGVLVVEEQVFVDAAQFFVCPAALACPLHLGHREHRFDGDQVGLRFA